MRIVTTFALLLLVQAAVAQQADWNKPHRPFRIYGNSYYVGTQALSSVLVTSDAGHVLIDGDLPESVPQIVANIKALGFRIEDVKAIVNSHTHWDHAGGIAELQRLSGANVVSSPYGAAALERGQGGKDDPQYTIAKPFPAVARASVIKDRDVLRVGSSALTVIYTPGHTPGGTSWTWQSCEGKECATMVYGDSLNAVSADDFRFSDSKTYPTALQDLRTSLETVEKLPCDILIAAHPEFSRLWERLERSVKEGPKAFIDKNGCRAYATAARARLDKRLEAERVPVK